MKPAIVVLNYNMPGVVAGWHEYITMTVGNRDLYFIVDNGSDEEYAMWEDYPEHRIIRVNKNLRTTGGVMLGAYYAKMMGATHLWTISASTLPPNHPWKTDPLEMLCKPFEDPSVICVAPTFVGESKSWPHQLLMSNGTDEVEDHWLVGMFSLWDIDFLLGYVDRRMTWSWGIDMELSAMARSVGYRLLMHNGVPLRLRENIGYERNRMGCTVWERQLHAREEMEKYLSLKWGDNWKLRLIPIEKYREMM